MLSTAIHPSNCFTDIKEKQLGSIPLCLLLLVLYYVVTVMKSIAGGFLFSKFDAASFNSILVLFVLQALLYFGFRLTGLFAHCLAVRVNLKKL